MVQASKSKTQASKRKSKPKAPVISPYSSYGLIKGALISDTLQVFQGWDLELSKRDNLARVRANNCIGAPTQAWLKQVCTTFSRRFDPSGRDKPLTLAAKSSIGQSLEAAAAGTWLASPAWRRTALGMGCLIQQWRSIANGASTGMA